MKLTTKNLKELVGQTVQHNRDHNMFSVYTNPKEYIYIGSSVVVKTLSSYKSWNLDHKRMIKGHTLNLLIQQSFNPILDEQKIVVSSGVIEDTGDYVLYTFVPTTSPYELNYSANVVSDFYTHKVMLVNILVNR